MPSKQCGKCGETVDGAKAFCPGCGNAFVEERTRDSVSDFNLSEHTVRLGDTMYNQMLSDMGLNISKEPNRSEARVAVIPPQPETRSEQNAGPSAKISTNRKWIIIAISLIGVALAILAVIAIAAGVFLYLR